MKKFVILAGAALGGIFGWFYPVPDHIGPSIVAGIMTGTFVAAWIWSVLDDL